MREVVAVDVGGTHARFALARVAEGCVVTLDAPCTLKTAEHPSMQAAWKIFGNRIGRPLPTAVAIAFAGPVDGAFLKLTNSPWVIRPALIGETLGVDHFTLINDFGAIAHAVAQLEQSAFRHLCGPDAPPPTDGVISIIGPGTGLGVAQLIRAGDGYTVVETEGGHVDFAPLDPLEDSILQWLRERHRRVSVERVASGMGLRNIYDALAALEGVATPQRDEKALWEAALAGDDRLASTAFDRFCLALGAFAGDIALAQGADAVVIAGGLGLRIADRLVQSGFRDRFIAKGRFERRMEKLPVKIITHSQPGLYGAAAAFAREHRR